MIFFRLRRSFSNEQQSPKKNMEEKIIFSATLLPPAPVTYESSDEKLFEETNRLMNHFKRRDARFVVEGHSTIEWVLDPDGSATVFLLPNMSPEELQEELQVNSFQVPENDTDHWYQIIVLRDENRKRGLLASIDK